MTGGPRTNEWILPDRPHSSSKGSLGNPRTVQTPYVMGLSIIEMKVKKEKRLGESEWHILKY
jgi:hypothetical protein